MFHEELDPSYICRRCCTQVSVVRDPHEPGPCDAPGRTAQWCPRAAQISLSIPQRPFFARCKLLWHQSLKSAVLWLATSDWSWNVNLLPHGMRLPARYNQWMNRSSAIKKHSVPRLGSAQCVIEQTRRILRSSCQACNPQEWMWIARHKAWSSVRFVVETGFSASFLVLFTWADQVGILGLLVIYAQAGTLSCSK